MILVEGLTRMPHSSIYILVEVTIATSSNSCNNQICHQTFPGISWLGAVINVTGLKDALKAGEKKKVFLDVSLSCFIGINGNQENASSINVSMNRIGRQFSRPQHLSRSQIQADSFQWFY